MFSTSHSQVCSPDNRQHRNAPSVVRMDFGVVFDSCVHYALISSSQHQQSPPRNLKAGDHGTRGFAVERFIILDSTTGMRKKIASDRTE